jgi:exodeoxyribonuclease VII small subunit
MAKKKDPNDVPLTPEAIAELSYEAVVERLEGTVERLEAGDLTLEDQLAAFEEGMTLLRAGQRLLDAAERRVEILLESGEKVPFDPDAAHADDAGEGP